MTEQKENSVNLNNNPPVESSLKSIPEVNNQSGTQGAIEGNINPDDKVPTEQNKSINQEKNNQGSTTTIPQNTAYPDAHWVVLESILQRNGLPIKPTNFTLEVIGIYSPPDFWNKLEQSGAVDAWYYQVNVGEAKCINGKMNARELTEEEKNAAENKKKPPPKVDKKNPEAVKAEEERLKKIQDEKDEKERQFYDELNKLDPLQRYYKIKEMPTQCEWISFADSDKSNTVELKDEKLIEMEDCINDEHKIIIEVNKVPPPDENEKKRPKPKNMNPEDIKPIYSVGLADLTQFYAVPGKKEIVLRTFLMSKETYDKRKENNIDPIVQPFEPKETDLKASPFGPTQTESSKKEEKTEKKTEKKESDISAIELDYIEEAHTYIYYKLKFSESINPKIPGFEDQSEPNELIKTEKKQNINIVSEPTKQMDILSKPEEKEDVNKSQSLKKQEKSEISNKSK